MVIKEKDKAMLVANYFVKKNEEEQKGLSPLKIQKLLYYAQAWNLVMNDEKLFENDFEAWVHGPAIPHVWQYFREFDFSSSHPEFLEKEFSEFSDKEKEVLEMVWHIYGKFDGKYLETLTHTEDPWLQARRGLDSDVISQNIISSKNMKTYYGRRFKEAAGA